MCNLQRLNRAPAEVARLFGAVVGNLGNFALEGGETYPGQPGLVIIRQRTTSAHPEPVEGHAPTQDLGAPTLTSMTWGFPYSATGKSGQKLKPRPVNNARADKLGSFMWRDSFAKRRCLIPLTAFAEAEGEAGAKTRTWFSLPESEAPGGVFAAAGLWRQTDEWGLCYTMVMTEACVQVAEVHDRMPVILRRRDWATWLDGPVGPAHAELVEVPYPELMVVERTAELWVKR